MAQKQTAKVKGAHGKVVNSHRSERKRMRHGTSLLRREKEASTMVQKYRDIVKRSSTKKNKAKLYNWEQKLGKVEREIKGHQR